MLVHSRSQMKLSGSSSSCQVRIRQICLNFHPIFADMCLTSRPFEFDFQHISVCSLRRSCVADCGESRGAVQRHAKHRRPCSSLSRDARKATSVDTNSGLAGGREPQGGRQDVPQPAAAARPAGTRRGLVCQPRVAAACQPCR